MNRVMWPVVSILVIAGWMLVPGVCCAQARCPWLNAATAAGVLGGEVQMTVTEPVEPGKGKGVGAAMYSDQVRMDRFDVSCEFSRKVESGSYTLGIVVKTMSDPAKEFPSFLALCSGSTVALNAIGNEAAQCLMKDGPHAGHELVIARVRDRAFTLTIHREVRAHAADSEQLSDEARNVAEQVAGSLF